MQLVREISAGLSVTTAYTTHPDTQRAITEIVMAVMTGRDCAPDFVSIHHGASRPASELWPALIQSFGAAALHGATSSQGVMTERGIHDEDDDAIGVFALWDQEGAFGTAMEPLGECARTAAGIATRTALGRAGRSGEAPAIVWIAATPGREELVLEGIKDVVGSHTLIVGGSAADALVSGAWSVFSSDGFSGAGVVVSVLFPSTPFASVYGSGYAPTDRAGIVTAAEGRSLKEIDGRPAANVYSEWRDDDALRPSANPQSILVESALAPLGRRQTDNDKNNEFLLAHPAVACPDGSLEVFADVHVGEELRLMSGSKTSLVQRAGRIARKSRERLAADVPAGALVVYCGGCMMAVRDRMPEVVAELNASLGGAPFLGVFTFGEQGESLDRGAVHANLMISCTTFCAHPD